MFKNVVNSLEKHVNTPDRPDFLGVDPHSATFYFPKRKARSPGLIMLLNKMPGQSKTSSYKQST